LEEVAESDLLIHVVDASAARPEEQIAAVREVLAEIDADDIGEVLVFNKADVAPGSARELATRHAGALVVAASTGEGIDELLQTVGDRLRARSSTVEFVVPFERGDVLAALHREGEVLREVHEEGGTRVQARLDAAGAGRFREFAI
jgi:GTP-binding protein HflX